MVFQSSLEVKELPIYEYIAVDSHEGCDYCRHGFAKIQKISDLKLQSCPRCSRPVIKVMSSCAVLIAGSNPNAPVEKQVRDYEREGMFSHAAELADKSGLDERARENYKKAGYNF